VVVQQQSTDEAEDGARLLAVAGDDHHRRALPALQIPSVVEEGREIDRDQSEHEALAAAPAAHEPSLLDRLGWRRGAAGVPLIDGELLGRHGQREQRGQEREPRSPGVVSERLLEQRGIIARFENSLHAGPRRAHAASSSSTVM
jgi:hypothetical protein